MQKSSWPNVLARKRSPFSLLVKFWSRVRFLFHAIWCKISPTRYKTSLHDKRSTQIRNGINVLKYIPQMKFRRIYPSSNPIGFNGGGQVRNGPQSRVLQTVKRQIILMPGRLCIPPYGDRFHQHHVIRLKAEVAMERADQATYGDHGRCDQHRADCDLHHQQQVANRNPRPVFRRILSIRPSRLDRDPRARPGAQAPSRRGIR